MAHRRVDDPTNGPHETIKDNSILLRVEHLQVGESAPISFEVNEGQCLAIVGPSGSGKTRLLRAISDLDESEGQVFIKGAERNEVSAPHWRQIVRYGAAEPAWWTDTPRPSFPDEKEKVPQLQKLLRSLNLDSELLDRPISKLSTGERQRLALVRALIDEPEVIALDEPTASLDATNAALVEELIRYQLLSNKIVLLVSHNEAQIARLANNTLDLGSANPTVEKTLHNERTHP